MHLRLVILQTTPPTREILVDIKCINAAVEVNNKSYLIDMVS